MTSNSLTCKEFIEFLSSYLDAELTAEQQQIFAQHLAICPACVDYMASYKQTVDLLKDKLLDDKSELPEQVPEGLVDAILAARSSFPDFKCCNLFSVVESIVVCNRKDFK